MSRCQCASFTFKNFGQHDNLSQWLFDSVPVPVCQFKFWQWQFDNITFLQSDSLTKLLPGSVLARQFDTLKFLPYDSVTVWKNTVWHCESVPFWHLTVWNLNSMAVWQCELGQCFNFTVGIFKSKTVWFIDNLTFSHPYKWYCHPWPWTVFSLQTGVCWSDWG